MYQNIRVHKLTKELVLHEAELGENINNSEKGKMSKMGI